MSKREWNGIRQSLAIVQAVPAPTAETEAETALKGEILELWDKRDTCEKDLAPRLYSLCVLLNAQGQKGEGFSKFLCAHNRPRSTAYRWIDRYAKREGLPLPYPAKPPNPHPSSVSASSRMGQGQPSITGVPDAEYEPAPNTTGEAISHLRLFFETLPLEVRIASALQVKDWLEARIAAWEHPTTQEDSSGD